MKTVRLKKFSITIMLAIMVFVIAFSFTTQIALAGSPVFMLKGDINYILGPPPDNYCTGEPMEAQGKVVLLMLETNTGMVFHINGAGATMTGTETGTFYRFNGALNEFISNDGGVFHYLHHFTWFSPSNGDAFIATYVSHTTINGNGDVTADFDFVNGGCQ